MHRFFRAAACAAIVPLAGGAFAQTKRVEVPLVIPTAFLERLLIEQVFTEPETSARIVAGADPCNEIVLSQPALRPLGGRFVVTAHGRAQAGFTLFGTCYRPFQWEGKVEADEDARVAAGAPAVEFRVLNSWLEDESRLLAVPALWDWVKPEVHPRLETLRVDLAPLIDELRHALPLFARQRDAPALRRLVGSLGLADARVEERGLVLRLHFDVEAPAPMASMSPIPEPPLGPDEIAAFETTLHEWDAFLTFVIKTAGRDTLEPALRAALLAVLIDGRHEIVAALAEPERDGEDRVRALFVSSWTQLQPALSSLVGAAPGLGYLAFVASGDALAALDAVGPAFGFEISHDGLRRLARTLAPEASEDPLRWSEDVDPVLRETFDFEAELPALPPVPPLPPASEPPTAEPGPSAATRWLDWLLPAAFAAPDPPSQLGPYTSALDGFAPRIDDLDSYLPAIAALLRESSAQVFAHGRLGAERRELFDRLVLATAWQESCWRQYVRRKGELAPLRSSVGALGLMQVNPHVWRGFYAVDGLAFSIGYNARAGGEILLHYLRDYAIARGEEGAGGPDALARATYAVYHGGPSQLRRYRHPSKSRPALVAVDRAFHAKFREVEAGRELGVRECFAG